jgi:hypothetical protein
LTLSQANDSFLVAFLALFVSFVGTSFFRITCFAIHHILSTTAAQDEIHHQRQAILRNAASGTHALLSTMNMFWAHRSQRFRRKRLFGQLIPLVVHAAACIAVFFVAGIFSSRITGLTGDEVLVIGLTKPEPNPAKLADGEFVRIMTTNKALNWNDRARYAQDCYGDNVPSGDSETSVCRKFVKDQIKRIINRNASCPFSPELCRSQTGNIEIDSGFLDSQHDLGMNTPEKDRTRIRNLIKCAPLATEGYVEKRNLTVGGLSLPYAFYYYGSFSEANHTLVSPLESPNMTDPIQPFPLGSPRYSLQ